jgi:RND family efflux transporter MFP subunit
MNILLRYKTAILGFLLALLAGCDRPPMTPKTPKIPDVTVSAPLLRTMPDFEFTGEIQAIRSVNVQPQVGGVLKTAALKEGTEVKEGALLFQIDPEPFEIEALRARAELERARKDFGFAEAEAKRAKQLLATKAISATDYDKALATEGIKKADADIADANLKKAEMNLRYAKITAEISGRVGRKLVTEGNLIRVGGGDTPVLTTIFYLDQVYAIFYVDERTAQLYRKERDPVGKSDKVKIKVTLGLNTDGDAFPHQGVVDFAATDVDSATGTFLVRAIFDNPKRVLVPGYTARLRVYIGEIVPSIVISERALLSDKGKDFVYVMNDKKVVDRKFVQLGKKAGELVEVADGLTKDDLVVVYGLQRLRPGITVNAENLVMPGAGTDAKK